MKCKQCKREIANGSTFCNWCGKKQISDSKRGEITIPEPRQLSSGKWFIQLRISGTSTPITEDTPEKCRAKARAVKTGLINIKARPDNITLRDACTKYIENHRSRLSPTTAANYEYVREKRFQGIMDMPLPGITKSMLDKAVGVERSLPSRKGGAITPKTIRNAYLFLVSVLNTYAPEIDTSIRLPEVQRTIPNMIPPEQLFTAVKGTNVELPCLLAMWLSLSMSEIRGLSKSKSIQNNKISVRETVVDVKNEVVRKSGGKEETRPRSLDIPPYIQQLIDNVDSDVLVPESGHAIYMRFQKVLENNNLPHMSFHQLRHINASVMAALGIPEKEANERGGWKTDYTRKRVYTHTFTEQRKQADKKINTYFESIIANENANAF